MSQLTSISPLAIDLGGMYTGVFMGHYLRGELPTAEHCTAATIVLPKDGDKITWSQVKRTATRHRIRGNKRRKLAKRLLKIVFSDGLNHHCTPQEWQAISGLLNRRGYNRVEAELDLSPLANVDAYWIADALPDYFNADLDLDEQWQQMQEDVSLLRKLQSDERFSLGKKDAKARLFKQTDIEKEEREKLLAAFFCLQDAVNGVINNADFGHQHRRDYLAAIRQEIAQDSRLAVLREKIGSTQLYQLIGNVSNLQLRTLRWYFNDEGMKAADYFDDQCLKTVVIRWLNYWHPDKDSLANRDNALAHISQHGNSVKALCELDPLLTIPPYEDQNNRRPPKDQTLWLDPRKMQQHYGEQWLLWVSKLLLAQADWAEGINEQLQKYERQSRLPSKERQPLDNKYYHAAIFLQRILDRSKALDPYALRSLLRAGESQHKTVARAKLARDVGEQHVENFLTFCQRYYRELELAKQGLWRDSDANLFERANINPPSKKKIKHLLVGNILKQELTEQTLEMFVQQVWKNKFKGSSSVLSIARNAEEQIKKYGSAFNMELSKLRYRVERLGQSDKSFTAEQKKMWQLHQNCHSAARYIAQYFQHSQEQCSKYSNVYSMAQLFALLETDRHGFSSVSLAAHQELNWRMTQLSLEGGEFAARCSRLAADTVRPFDGVLRRTLDRAAYEIAKRKAAQIQAQHQAGVGIIEVPIIAEENRFSFSMGLAELKGNNAKRKEFLEKLKGQQDSWLKKQDQIKEANQYCPYNGSVIGEHGEIDHIIPRAQSLAGSGTVFNSQANLIWCSRAGNQKKREQRYHLSDLHGNYLHEVFQMRDTQQIAAHIEAVVGKLPQDFIYQSLSLEQQRCVQHALFLPSDSEAYQTVVRRLAVAQAARVNGTQAWLVRSIIEKIEQQLAGWCREQNVELQFHAARVSPELAQRVRRNIADIDPALAKQTPQPVASHAVDAMCALAVAASSSLCNELALGEGVSEDPEYLLTLLPNSVDLVWVESKARFNKQNIFSQPVFKEGIYSERFLPLWCNQSELLIGFNPDTSAIAWQGKDRNAMLGLLQPVLADSKNLQDCGQQAKHDLLKIDSAKAFELLAKVATEPATDDELALADLLDALRYVTAKKDCFSKLYNAAKKSYATRDDILKKQNFEITLKYSHKRYGKFEGKLQLPAYADWEKLLAQEAISSRLGKIADDFDWLAFAKNYFGEGSDRAHGKTRRVFSLPMLDAPSGGFRVLRQTESGEALWQVTAIDGTASQGFAVRDGKIDWNDSVAIDGLTHSGLVGFEQRWQTPAGAVVHFDAWLSIAQDIPDVVSVAMAPGTKDRRYIRIEQELATFVEWLESATEIEQLTSPLSLPHQIKVDANKFYQCHQAELLGKPRSNLFIEKIGQRVRYWYIVESSNTAMKTAYQEAYSSRK